MIRFTLIVLFVFVAVGCGNQQESAPVTESTGDTGDHSDGLTHDHDEGDAHSHADGTTHDHDGGGDGQGGGGGDGRPNKFDTTKFPRGMGDVVVPFAVTFNTLACVSKPPRGLSDGSATRRISCPVTSATP